jgi:hypothetical protein
MICIPKLALEIRDILLLVLLLLPRLDDTLVKAWPKRIGPLQHQVRCMVSDQPSKKLPVPHLGHDGMIVFETDVICAPLGARAYP